jgi:hypothetical protein
MSFLTVTLHCHKDPQFNEPKKLNSDLDFRFAERLHHAGRISTQKISNLSTTNVAYSTIL